MDDVGGVSVFPTAELFAQLALIAGAAVGMEFYARFAHKYLWHDGWWSMPMKYRKDWNKKIWLLHESHHLPREGAFEANDIFAVANGVLPQLALAEERLGQFAQGERGSLRIGMECHPCYQWRYVLHRPAAARARVPVAAARRPRQGGAEQEALGVAHARGGERARLVADCAAARVGVVERGHHRGH